MINGQTPKFDLHTLEADDEFRAAYLFYLQAANTYLASIFWHVFGKDKKRQLYTFLENHDKALKNQANRAGHKAKGLDETLMQSLVPPPQPDKTAGERKSRFLDCYNAGFGALLLAMPENFKISFKRKLSHEHAIPLTLEGFCDGIDALRMKRNYLKDWARKHKQSTRPDDRETLHMLGLLLPAKLHQHFCGVVSRTIRRQVRKKGYVAGIDEKKVRVVFSAARKDRALATKKQFGTRKKVAHLTPAKQRKAKSERKAREHSKTACMHKYAKFYPDGVWPRARYHNFKALFYFMGPRHVKRIMTELEQQTDRDGKPLPGGIHFDRDIVVAHMIGLQINNILDLAYWRLTAEDKARIETLKKGGLTKKKAEQKVKVEGAISADSLGIRNAIAHNGLFWSVREGEDFLDAKVVFARTFAAFYKPHIRDRYQQINDIYCKIEGALRQQKYDWVFPANDFDSEGNPKHTPPLVIRRWTKAAQVKYTDKTKWRIDRRAKVRALFGSWMNALVTARDQAKTAEQKRIFEHSS